jgi:hypothetical protein
MSIAISLLGKHLLHIHKWLHDPYMFLGATGVCSVTKDAHNVIDKYLWWGRHKTHSEFGKEGSWKSSDANIKMVPMGWELNWTGLNWYLMVSFDIVGCSPVARQRPRSKRLCNSRYWVTAAQTSMFPGQQLHCKRETVFSMRSVLRFCK